MAITSIFFVVSRWLSCQYSLLLSVTGGHWDLGGYHVNTLGEPHVSVRCLCAVNQRAWCAYRNQVHVVSPESLDIEVILHGKGFLPTFQRILVLVFTDQPVNNKCHRWEVLSVYLLTYLLT